MIAAYVDGRLSGADRAAVEAHLAACERCYPLFSEAARFELEERGAAKVVYPRFGRGWIALAVAACLIAAAVPLALRLRARRNARPDVAELVAAVGAERPFEPRLTGGFQFGPMKPVYRSASQAENESWELLAAAAKIRKKSEEKNSVQALADLGVAQLLLSKYDDAVSSLEEANLRAPKDAQILTDLSAAYLVRAKEKDRADDYPKALEAAEKATELDPKILEAWFNRAYALDELPLKSEAAKAWKDYLNRDPKSGWAAEARKRLAAIEAIPNHAEEWKKAKAKMLAAAKAGDEKTLREIMPDYCQETREWIEEELLPQWAKAELSGKNEAQAEQDLRESGSIADVHSEIGRDPMMKEVVESVASAVRAGSTRQVARGILDYADGKVLHRAFRIPEAARQFDAAAAAFRSTNNPLRYWAEYYEASCAYYAVRQEDALKAFSALAPAAEQSGFFVLAARCRMMKGLCLALKEDFAAADHEYETSKSEIEASRESENLAFIDSLIADQFLDLGEPAREWRLRRSGLECLEHVGSARASHMLLEACALSLSNSGAPSAALHFQKPATKFAARSDSLSFAESEEMEGDLYHKIGQTRASQRAFDAAMTVVSRLDDPKHRERLSADIELKRGEAFVDILPSRSEQDLAASLDYFRTVGLDDYFSEAELYHGRALFALGRKAEAAREFESGIAEMERARKTTRSFEISFFDRARPLVDEIVRSEIERGSAVRALEWIERTRAQDLLARRRGPVVGSQPIARIQAALPRDTSLVYYHELSSGLLTWVVSRESVWFHSGRMDIGALNRRVENVVTQARRREDVQLDLSLEDLYSALIRPLPSGERRERIVFVPDGPLGLVPFAALKDPSTRKYVVEDHEVEIVPSGSFFRTSQNPPGPGAPASVLSVGFSGVGLRSELVPLPKAEKEATEVASLYRNQTLLIGAKATPSALKRFAPAVDVIHFSGHAVVNADAPARSYLACAAESEREGRLYAGEISTLDLSRTRLVDLASCGAASGEVTRMEGVLNLARPFVMAGAHSVSAALWDVPDSETEELDVRFQRAIVSGASPDRAQRLADISAIHDRNISLNPPRVWGAFEVIAASSF